jgi:hypothetical protein
MVLVESTPAVQDRTLTLPGRMRATLGDKQGEELLQGETGSVCTLATTERLA